MRNIFFRTKAIIAVITIAGLMTASGARAQDTDSNSDRDSKSDGSSASRAEDTIEALLIVAFKKDLGLETAEAVDLASRTKVLLEARRDFARQQSRIRRDLMDAVDSANPQKDKIDSLINEAFQARATFSASQQKAFFDLTQGMTPAQRGKLFVSIERFEERVRSHLRRFQEGGGRRSRGRDSDDDDDL